MHVVDLVSLLDQFEPIFFNALLAYQFTVSWLKVANIVGIGRHSVLSGRDHSISFRRIDTHTQGNQKPQSSVDSLL